MAKKQTKSKTESRDRRRSPALTAAAVVVFFLTGVWVGSGGVQYKDSRLLLNKPDVQAIVSTLTGEDQAPRQQPKPVINKKALSFFKDGYGDCTVSEIISVYDGDTFRCNIDGLAPIIGKNISVRLRGIDTPEMNDKSPYIQARAIDARDFTKRKLMSARQVELRNIDRDKYFRILADVYVDGESLADMLLSAALANKYDGGKKTPWE
jgi:micrococcal nuclease